MTKYIFGEKHLLLFCIGALSDGCKRIAFVVIQREKDGADEAR